MISLGTDLGMGQSMEHVMRQSVIALRLAERLGLDEEARAVVYYVGLLGWVGCHVDAYEQAKWFGDEQALKADYRRVDLAGAAARGAFVVRHAGAGRGVAARARLGVRLAADGRRVANTMIENHCVATRELAAALGLGHDVREALYLTFARWDGKGVPAEAAGERIPLPARLVTLADVVEIYHRSDGLRRGGRGRARAARDAVRSGARRRVLRRGGRRVRRHRRGDDVACGDRRRAGAGGRPA